jgi:hypothetical protein
LSHGNTHGNILQISRATILLSPNCGESGKGKARRRNQRAFVSNEIRRRATSRARYSGKRVEHRMQPLALAGVEHAEAGKQVNAVMGRRRARIADLGAGRGWASAQSTQPIL